MAIDKAASVFGGTVNLETNFINFSIRLQRGDPYNCACQLANPSSAMMVGYKFSLRNNILRERALLTRKRLREYKTNA